MVRVFNLMCAGILLCFGLRLAVAPATAQGGFLRVSDGSHTDSSPTWSPDGSHIAFVRQIGTEFEIRQVASSGGASTLVATFPPGWNYGGGNLEWSPTGDRLALYTGPVGDEAIYVVSVFEQPTPGKGATWGQMKDRYRK